MDRRPKEGISFRQGQLIQTDETNPFPTRSLLIRMTRERVGVYEVHRQPSVMFITEAKPFRHIKVATKSRWELAAGNHDRLTVFESDQLERKHVN